jgi:tRNA dimethylallyltransferase
MNKSLIIIAGPTAVGKTDLAIHLALALQAEIINADSRQVYREMRIGTAVPADTDLKRVKHHCMLHKSIHEPYNASMYELEVTNLLPVLFGKADAVLLAGGSGMYINAVCHGIDDIPTVDPLVRKRLRDEFENGGLALLHARLRQADPVYFSRVDLNNPNRILKALEITEMTGRPYSSFLTGKSKHREFNIIRIGLDRPRNEIHQRINSRVDAMLEAGLVDEARGLYPFRQLNALNTLGYKELFEYFDGKLSLDMAVEQIKGHTRQYARRQLTWFRRDRHMHWFHPLHTGAVLAFIQTEMK